jgi:hypothetical protein
MNAASLLVWSVLAVGQAAEPLDFYQDLRQRGELQAGVRLSGSFISKYTFPEAEGLRVALPAKRESLGTLGLMATFPVPGDFEITGSYELLAADTPHKSNGLAGVNFYLVPGTDNTRFAKLGRYNTPGGPVYFLFHKNRQLPQPATILTWPTTEKTGQLRLTRQGSKLIYLMQDATTAGQFKELFQEEFGTDELTTVRFVVSTNDEPLAIEARLLDLRIRSGSVPAPTDPVPTDPVRPPGGRVPLGLALGVFVAVLLTAAAFAWRRRPQRE